MASRRSTRATSCTSAGRGCSRRATRTRSLLGDYLYAHGLVRLSAAGSVAAVADLAELISFCAQLQAKGEGDDGPAWAACVALLGHGALKESDEPEALVELANEAAGEQAVDRALAAHRQRVR